MPSTPGEVPLPNQPPEELPRYSSCSLGTGDTPAPAGAPDLGAGGLAAYLDRHENPADPRAEGGEGDKVPCSPSIVSDNAVSEYEEVEAKNWRQHLNLLLEDPDSSTPARILSHCMLLTIILSIAGFILQTLPSVQDFVLWNIIEIGSTAIFTLEYILRLLVCNAFGDLTRLGFMRMPMNILDVLAILPFYVERSLETLELKPFRVLRSARLIRIFRIFKLSKYSLGMNLMVESLLNSVHPLSILAFFLGIGVLLFSTLLYYAERTFCPTVKAEEWQAYQAECADSSSGRTRNGDLCCNEHNSAMGFPSISQTFWWSMVTMTTVGYGDMVPRTSLGRIVAGLAMISGIILISLPVAIVGAKFQTAYEEFELDREEMLLLEQEDKERSRSSAAIRSGSSGPSTGKIQAFKKLNAAMKLIKVNSTSSPRKGTPKGRSSLSLEQDEEMRLSARALRQHAFSGKSKRLYCPIVQAIKELSAKLEWLESRSAMSPAATEQLGLLLELFEHAKCAERQLVALREKDAALDACIRADFAALSRRYDTCLTAELMAG